MGRFELSTANKVWEAYFGYNKVKANDAFGNLIFKNQYGRTAVGGWELDHIWPAHHPDVRGANVYSNLQPLSNGANAAKSNKNTGVVNRIPYKVTKVNTNEKGNFIGRMQIFLKNKWLWAYPIPRY